MKCCEPGCQQAAEYVIWWYGQPAGLVEQYEVIGGYARYEAYSHSCAAHLDALRGDDPREEVVHLSRTPPTMSVELDRKARRSDVLH